MGQYALFNDTDVREMHFIISGHGKKSPIEKRDMYITTARCLGDCGLEKLNETIQVEGEPEIIIPPLFWSLNTTWPSGKVPEAGDDVHIMPNMSVIFDLAESPVYKLIRVNGILTFKDD
jgi:hypothetical protein